MVQREEQMKRELGERLRRALERQGDPRKQTIRSLEDAMKRREADIKSYGAIRAYVQGEKLPPLTFLVEAAETLSVRPEWLILGEGEMTEAEEQLAPGRGLAEHPELEAWPARTREVFAEVLGSYVLQTPQHEELTGTQVGQEKWAELERELTFLTTLPLRSWGFRDLEELSERERLNYLLSMLNALLVAVKRLGDGDALTDHTHSLLPTLRRAANQSPELTEEEIARAERLEEALAG